MLRTRVTQALHWAMPMVLIFPIALLSLGWDIALGNLLGSNLFNTLVVVGIAGLIHPIPVESEVVSRDMPMMGGLTLLLFFISYDYRGWKRIHRLEGAILLVCYVGYVAYLVTLTFFASI